MKTVSLMTYFMMLITSKLKSETTLQMPMNVLHRHQISELSFVPLNEAAAELSFIWSHSAV